MVVGPISSGKSTLLKGILGETPICNGSVQILSDSIAFCDQIPWMTNETLRANIIGPAHFDSSWYTAVVRACALEEDLNHIEGGDQVVIGSNGLSLSGGQKQRVVRNTCLLHMAVLANVECQAIARAVYAKRHIALFDDVFSGQDMNTQARIMRDVFGPQGLLRANGCTIVLVTHAGMRLFASQGRNSVNIN
jgi:ATP-binding cassette, subfamily C (CFTR/MRP), member 1